MKPIPIASLTVTRLAVDTIRHPKPPSTLIQPQLTRKPTMRFDPLHCPECGELARGTCDLIPALGLLLIHADGSAEYEGETKVLWDGQYTDTDEEGRVTLACPEGHLWPATMSEGE